LTRLKSL